MGGLLVDLVNQVLVLRTDVVVGLGRLVLFSLLLALLLLLILGKFALWLLFFSVPFVCHHHLEIAAVDDALNHEVCVLRWNAVVVAASEAPSAFWLS